MGLISPKPVLSAAVSKPGEHVHHSKADQAETKHRKKQALHDESSYEPNRAAQYSAGRGTGDDSIGRGTSDDSIGKHTQKKHRNVAGDDCGPGSLNHVVLGAVSSHLSTTGKGSLSALLSGSEVTRNAVAHLVSAPQFGATSLAMQERLLNLAAKTGEVGTRALAKMIDRPGFFKKANSQGLSMLADFEKMAKSKDKDVRRTLASTMADIANPARIWQGDSPTCTVTSMQFELAKYNPAEYARLMAGLSIDGKVTMAGGGELLRANIALDSVALKDQQRSISEALFQDSAMDCANGAEKYDSQLQQSVREDGTTHRGLNSAMIRDMVSQLTGEPYARHGIMDDQSAAGLAEELAARPKTSANKPVLIDLNEGAFNHCVAFERIDDKFVWFRDPETGRRDRLSLEEFNRQAVAAYAVE